MPANRINLYIDKKTNQLVYTRYISNGTILPVAIEQKLIPICEDTAPHTVTRMELLSQLMSKYKVINQLELATLYTDEEWTEPITWLEYAYLATYIFAITDVSLKPQIPFSNLPMPVSMIRSTNGVEERIKAYKQGMKLTEYIEDIRLGGSYLPVNLFIAYRLLQQKINVGDNYMFRQITKQNAQLLMSIRASRG